MFLDMCFLTFIAYRYKYIDVAVPKNLRKISVLSVRMEDFVFTETNNSITEMPNQEPRNRKISILSHRMEDFVTTETNNSITEMPNQETRKPSTTTTETIELN